MRNYTSNSRFKVKYNQEQNKFISKRLKSIKPTIDTKSPESFSFHRTMTNRFNGRNQNSPGTLCKLFILKINL